MSELYKSLLNLRGKYGMWGIGMLVLVGVAFMVFPGLFLHSGVKSPVPAGEVINGSPTIAGNPLRQLEVELAQQIGQVLGQVEGAGEVMVSLTLESGPEKDYALNVSDDRSTVEEKDTNGGTRVTTGVNHKADVVFAQGQKEALVIKEIGPQVKGILILADGAKDSEIKARLTVAVGAMLNIPAHRIMVLPKEGR